MLDRKIVAICAILKDEHQYLKEWIEHHLSLGVDCIYLYEDINSKSHSDIVNKYENVYLSLIKDFVDLPIGGEKQLGVYNQFIIKYRCYIDYAFFIDIDEFVIFENGYTIESLIKICDEKGPVLLPWKHYGANGFIDNPKTNLMSTYVKESHIEFPKTINECKLLSKTFTALTIGRLRHIHYCTNSKPIVPYDSENIYQICWINHYITKSWEEWCNRLFVRGQNNTLIRKIDDFFIYNPDMLPLKDELYNKPYCYINK